MISLESIQLITSVLQVTSDVIRERMKEQSELVELFNKATNEGRDLTDQEVELFRVRAKQAIDNMAVVNPDI